MRARRSRTWEPPIDLFPFLSMFLCILGVLSFLQIVMASTQSRRIVLIGEGQHGFRAPVQVFCTSAGAVVIEPVDGLRALLLVTRGEGHATLADLREERLARRRALARGLGRLRSRAAPMTRREMDALLDDVGEVNRLARSEHHAYEEFVLFGVYPGGGDTYEAFRALLATEHPSIESGVEVLDADYEMAPLEPLRSTR